MALLVAMLPVVELRGAIPYGIVAGLNLWSMFLSAVVGNMILAPFILLLICKILGWLRTFPWWKEKIDSLEKQVHLKGRVVHKYRTLPLRITVAKPA